MTLRPEVRKTPKLIRRLGAVISLCTGLALLFGPLGAAQPTPATPEIVVPRKKIDSPVYVVQPGDTLSEITSRLLKGRKLYGLESRMNWLLELNPELGEGHSIFPGQKINIYTAAENAARLAERTPSSLTEPNETGAPAPETPSDAQPRMSTSAPSSTPPPMAAPSPQATPAAPSESAESIYSWLSVRSQFGFYRIDAVDTTTGGSATILSTLSPGTAIDWEPVLNSKTRLRLGASIVRVYEQAPVPKTLSGTEINFFEFHASGMHEIINRVSLGAEVGSREVPFVRSISSTSIGISKVPLNYVKALADWAWFRSGNFTGALGLSYGRSLPTQLGSYPISAGTLYGGHLKFSQTVRSVQLQAGLTYQQDYYESSIAKVTSSELIYTLGVSFKFGP